MNESLLTSLLTTDTYYSSTPLSVMFVNTEQQKSVMTENIMNIETNDNTDNLIVTEHQEMNKLFLDKLYKSMYRQIQKAHPYNKVEVSIHPFPQHLYTAITKRWVRYQPKRKKNGFQHYYKTEDKNILLQNMPLLTDFKDFKLANNVTRTMRIITNKIHPVRAIFSETKKRMCVSFEYEPDPKPEGWKKEYRTRRGVEGNVLRKQEYFEEK
jgi:hypothetical protein